ncbi:substrate-binding domain-containing protein [Chloroflexota bacterium]
MKSFSYGVGGSQECRLPTINDVARQAGVSPATVSRVIQGAQNVRPSTREKVERAIRELGYVPSAVAQSLRSKRTRSFALLVPDITNTFWMTVARGVQDIAHEHDYSVLLGNTDENPAKQSRYLSFLLGQQVDGFLIAPYDSDARNLDVLRRRSMPTVILDRRIRGWNVDSVLGDSISGARALVRHLVELGHERIAVISGPTFTSTAEDRVAGYCLAMAEAGFAIDPALVKRGEYRAETGFALANELLDGAERPTAIFAANNVIAMGAIDAVCNRGLRIPQDMALVSFDDLPETSLIFPFLTVVAQPAYDMGVNAAQMLLSRLESKVRLRPRQVALPLRLTVRHSCGSRLAPDGSCPLSLPVSDSARRESVLVKPLTADQRRVFAQFAEDEVLPGPVSSANWSDYDKPRVQRLLDVLQHREADRLPHLDLDVSNPRIYEYVLERELDYDGNGPGFGVTSVSPEDQVDYARRLGMDAIACRFAWRPTSSDPTDLEAPPSLTHQLSYLERFLRAAQGAGVGIIASFTSFYGTARAAQAGAELGALNGEGMLLSEQLMDTILERQERVMRVVCDRFSDDLALVTVEDDIADHRGLVVPLDSFAYHFEARMRRLIAPAREHGKLLMLRATGGLTEALPLLREIGFDSVQPCEPESNDLGGLRRSWKGKMSFVGGFPLPALEEGDTGAIERLVREYCTNLAPGGGYVLGAAGTIGQKVTPESVVAMTRAAHRYGRYASLGRDGQMGGASTSMRWDHVVKELAATRQ